MNRLKALYRSWAIPCAGAQVYAPRHRAEWLAKITEAGVRRRAELYYEQLDALRSLHKQAKKELLSEGRKHSATKLLRQIPGIGPLRATQLVALMQTPHRFRTKRQLWNYSGLGLETHDGSSHLGAEDCRDHTNRVEERSKFRRQTFKTSSLSASDRESVSHP
jgi:transposase